MNTNTIKQLFVTGLILASTSVYADLKNNDLLNKFDSAKKQATTLKDKIQKEITVTDEETQKYFSAHPELYNAVDTRTVSQILVKTSAEAKTIQAQLKKGGDFAALAKTKSLDASSTNGGNLGEISKGQLVPELEKAIFAMKKGAVSSVKTKKGYHVIRLDEITTRPQLKYDDVKSQIRDTLLKDKKQKALDSALGKGKS